jgi:hypothetical protein
MTNIFIIAALQPEFFLQPLSQAIHERIHNLHLSFASNVQNTADNREAYHMIVQMRVKAKKIVLRSIKYLIKI